MSIVIRKSSSADTRTADHQITKDELRRSSEMHISDVCEAMDWLGDKVRDAGVRHDWTKLENLDEFYDQFHREQVSGKGDWIENPDAWYRAIHLAKERHHLDHSCPDDVDLVDVMEFIVDGVMAGLARSGKYEWKDIPQEVLQRACRNTAMKLVDNTVVVK